MKKLLSLSTIILTCVVITVLSTFNVGAWDNGLAKTPPMGWNSWNIFHGDINETKIKQIADAMVSSGMKDAGYVYLNLDDNWMANPARDANGNLRADPTRFPSGLKALSDYVHAKGLKLGIYGDRGTMTCMNVPQSGSKGYEDKDAKTFASWGIDYLKYDNCNIPNGSDQKTDYQKMQTALANCGRPIVFSICAWGYQSWMPATGNLWRTTGDITDKWDNGTDWFNGIINAIDGNAKYTSSAAPGAWNDPDMLEIGNGGCTTEEYRTQMSMWSMMASPLIAGNDIRTMNQTTKDILLNKEVIAVNQDSAGKQGYRVKSTNGLEIWVKPLGTDGTTNAVALLNRNASTSNITVNWSDIGLTGSITVRDLWAKADKGSFTGSYTASVPSHGTVVLKVSSAPPAPVDAFEKIEAENYSNQYGIQNVTCDEGTEAVGYTENGDYAVYSNVEFGDGASSFKARVSSATNGGNIEVRLDSITGPLIGTCQIAGTSDWQTFIDASCDVSGVSGKHDLYLKFTGESGYLFNLNWFTFGTGSVVTGKLGDINSDGAIDAIDFVLIKKHLLGLEIIENKLLADLDASGEVDAIDFAFMKQYLLGIITNFPGQGEEEPTESKFHYFLLLGQSNMAGYANTQASDKVEDTRVLVLGYDNNAALGRVTDQWDVACPPLHPAWLDAVGPGDWFGKTMIQKVPTGDTIGLIPCAISGEKIETFMKSGGTKYNWIINRAKLAQQKGGVIDGIIFHQGESNSGDTSWPGKVKTLVEDLRKDLNLGDVPFIAGELLYSGPCAGHNTLVNKLPSLITNCSVVSADGLVVDPSDTQYRLHFSHDSSVTLGKRYAEKMIQALGW